MSEIKGLLQAMSSLAEHKSQKMFLESVRKRLVVKKDQKATKFMSIVAEVSYSKKALLLRHLFLSILHVWRKSLELYWENHKALIPLEVKLMTTTSLQQPKNSFPTKVNILKWPSTTWIPLMSIKLEIGCLMIFVIGPTMGKWPKTGTACYRFIFWMETLLIIFQGEEKSYFVSHYRCLCHCITLHMH